MKESEKQIEDKKVQNQKLDQAKTNAENSSGGYKDILLKKESPPISGLK